VSWQIEACLDPTEAVKLEVGDLSENHEPAWYTSLNHDLDKPAWFLAREAGVLVGYLSVFDPSGDEAEVSAFVAPEHRRRGVFTALFAEARRVWAQPGRSWLLVVNRGGTAGTATASRWGRRSFSETTLVLSTPERPLCSGLPDGLVLTEGRAEDLDAAGTVFTLANGKDDHRTFLERILADPDRRFLVLKEGETAVGVGCLHKDGSETTVHGLVVRPDRQGQGWGRALLEALIDLGAPQTREFVIEVDSTNSRAEKLYRSVGFRDRCVTDYYEVTLPT